MAGRPRKTPSPGLGRPPASSPAPLSNHEKPLTCNLRQIVRPIQPGEIAHALPLFFTPQHQQDPQTLQESIDAFATLARRENYDLSRQIVALSDEKLVAACLCIHQQGRYAFALTSPCPPPTPSSGDLSHLAVETVRQSCLDAFKQGACFVQMLLEPNDTDRLDICCRAGFRRLTNLIYMLRIPPSPTPLEKPQPHLAWLSYQPGNHQQFKEVIAQTYQQSLDCPELENLRDMEDVIVAHRAGGQFDPNLWLLLLHRQEPAGALLLTPQPPQKSLEVTYMGLCPAYRKKGLATFIMHHALALAARQHTAALTLAVDERNAPACNLYRRFHFNELFRRTVLLSTPPE